MQLSTMELLAARDWIKECIETFRDIEEEDVDDLTDEEVEKGIKRHFSGGIEAFKEA